MFDDEFFMKMLNNTYTGEKISFQSTFDKARKYLSLPISKILCLNLIVFSFVFSLTGCDAVYRILHKEGAEEKEILGDIIPSETNERVVEAQKLLKLYGYKVGKTDGALGANTRNAIVSFQTDNALKETRFIDKTTWEKLHIFDGCGLVVKGELNFKVIQEALKRAGKNPGSIDGKPGRRTQAAIESFQKSKKLKADGKVGFKTLKHLAKYLSCDE